MGHPYYKAARNFKRNIAGTEIISSQKVARVLKAPSKPQKSADFGFYNAQDVSYVHGLDIRRYTSYQVLSSSSCRGVLTKLSAGPEGPFAKGYIAVHFSH